MPGFLFDTNIWIALSFAAHPFHDPVAEKVHDIPATQPIYKTRATELSSLRLLTTRAVYNAYGVPRLENREAAEFLRSLFAKVNCEELTEPKTTRKRWLSMASIETPSPKVWMDAYLASVAIEADLDFVTLDSGFRKYRSEGLSITVVR